MTYSSRIVLISAGFGSGVARRERLLRLDLLGDDVVAQPDALVADVDRRPGDELLHFLLRLSAEGAVKIAVPIISPSIHHIPASESLASRIVYGKD